MICENCGSSKESKVLDSRERQKFTYRKRKCLKCGYEYITHEVFVRGQTPIDARFTDTTVEFENGMIQIRKLYRKQWRVWNKKPSDKQIKEVEWNE